MSVIKLGALMAAIAMMLSPQARASGGLDLTTPEGNVEAMVKLRCSLDQTQDVILWWSGTIFSQLPGKAPSPILGFEGYNICRSEHLADGTWRLLTRELTFYRDLKTGQIIDHWDNPLSGERNAVIQVANDPVNTVLNSPTRPLHLPWVESGDQLMLTLNIPLTYSNPLSPKDFPKASSGETYVGSEHFTFFVPLAAMEDASLTQAPVVYGWTRLGPWLPWMQMGQAPGNLLYVAQGNKKSSIDQLPADIQERIRTTYPEYTKAPADWVQPNVTSWSYYKQMQQRQAKEDNSDKGNNGK